MGSASTHTDGVVKRVVRVVVRRQEAGRVAVRVMLAGWLSG